MSHAFVMLRDDHWLVITTDDGGAPRVTRVEAPTPSDFPEAARASADALSAGPRSRIRRVWVGLPSRWCFCAPLRTDGLPRTRAGRRNGLLFRLEEHLPVPAESVLASFAVAGGGALGVAALAQPVRAAVAALRAQRVHPHWTGPAALLVAQVAARRAEPAPDDVVIATDAGTDLVTLEQRRPARWRHLSPGPDELAGVLADEAARLGRPPSVVVVTESAEAAGDLAAALPAVAAVVRSCDPVSILTGPEHPARSLRRRSFDSTPPPPEGGAHRGPAALAAALALLLATVSGAAAHRARQYERMSRADVAAQQAIFREISGGQPVPPHVRSRLESELRRLRATALDDDAPVDEPSATSVLHQVLAALPRDVRIRATELRVQHGRLVFQGQARSHSDAEAVATSLRAAPADPGARALRTEPVRSETLRDGGVSFELTAASAPEGPDHPGGARP